MRPQSQPFTLAVDGDPIEQRYWHAFIARRFPSYERFWLAAVIDVTRRGICRADGRMRSDAELAEVGKGHEDVAVAQLHYTVMLHLGRVHDLLSEPLDRWTFAEVFVRLAGASDCADELLQRMATPRRFDAWSERAGREARGRWRNVHGHPLEDIHSYRNRMVHGRVVPEIIATDPETKQPVFIYPRLDRVDDYLDWRTVIPDPTKAIKSGDYAAAQVIALGAWERVVVYCEQAWATHLLS
jgi:hypothetical protein